MHTRSEFKMRWRNIGAVAFLIISLSCAYAMETQNHAPSSNTVIHHPTASLAIAGDLKDVKLKASIAQLVRALQHPSKLKETDRRSKLELVDKKSQPELITKHSTNVHSKDGRKLYYGAAIVPDAITISSQPIQIHSGANKTGGKRSRSLSSIDSEGVKTIEGIRVPDDEHDKHYTWRNARVIKGFLVPNDRSPNPHKKRQTVMITDPDAYLAAAAAAQAQGATTIIDGSSLPSQSGRQAGQATYSYSHHQAQQPQLQSSQQAHAYLQRQQNLGSGSTVYNTVGQTQSQQPVHQYQSATTSGQTTAFAYAPQQQGQMYVMPDGNSYVQYNPVQASQAHQQQSSQASHSQTQFYSRSGELPSSSATAQTPQVPSAVPQTVSDNQNQKDIHKFQQQLANAQAIQQAIQNQQPQQPQKSQIQPQSIQQVQEQGPSVQQVHHQQQAQSVQNQQIQQSNFVVPQGAASALSQQAQQVQDILAAASAASGTQYFQVQQPQESASTAQVYQVSGQNTFAERQSPYHTSQNGFVIQPQTYVAGPGGQAFTIPIPVPSDQVQSAQRRDDPHPNHNQRGEYYQHQQNVNSHNHNHQSDRNNLANRIMQSLHTNKKALDRMDTTTAVVPALASTGILLGLSALAAGWYLSRANREVGIVRRTGKPAAGSRTRRDVGTIPANYANQQEVDQATFFQSIIQQSLEKTQQQYEDPVEPVYNNQQQEPVYNREPEPEQRPNNNRPKYSRRERPSRPQHRNDEDDYDSNSKISKTSYAQDKSGAVTVASSKNFAKVFIPALILGLSVISITALIFFWYVTGANREIAFLEPQSYSTTHRRKRSLLGPQALSDGWLQRTITAIHGNPYDSMPAPTSKSLLPHPFMDRETSKTNDLEFKISNTGLTGVLAGGAIIAIIAFGLANSFSETSSRQLKTGRVNPSSSFSVNNQNALKHLRAPRAIDSINDLTEGHPDNPGFLAAILSNIDITQNSIMNKLQEAGKWQESPCAKRIFCDVMSTQDDDTIRVMEKRMATYINMLPESMSKKLSHTFSDVVSSIYKRDCSAFTCGGHRVDSSAIPHASSQVTQPR